MLPNVVGGWLADQTGPTWAIDPVLEVTPNSSSLCCGYQTPNEDAFLPTQGTRTQARSLRNNCANWLWGLQQGAHFPPGWQGRMGT